jgi:hypothetical protein
LIIFLSGNSHYERPFVYLANALSGTSCALSWFSSSLIFLMLASSLARLAAASMTDYFQFVEHEVTKKATELKPTAAKAPSQMP